MKERNAGIRSLDGDFAYTTLPREDSESKKDTKTNNPANQKEENH